MATKKKLLQAAAGQAGGEALNVEDVFSTYLYTGTGSAQTITNGLDLAGEGGLVWHKARGSATNLDHSLFDSETSTGATFPSIQKAWESNVAGSLATRTAWTFNSDGFTTTASDGSNGTDQSGIDYVTWSFRKCPKFFDVVNYTGNSTSGRTISHNLGVVPAMIIVLGQNTGDYWVYHKDVGNTKYLELNKTTAAQTNSGAWNNTTPTDSVFTVGNGVPVNYSGGKYTAYLFAHNDGDGEFGPNGDADIIKCGSYTGDGTTNGTNEVTLGWEPQWILTKRSDSADNWHICDVMRGQTTDGITQRLRANTSAAESANYGAVPTSTGFKLYSDNSSGGTYIYIAIRRGPMAVPESATDVFSVDALNATPTTPGWQSGFPVDMYLSRRTDNTVGHFVFDRLRGDKYLQTSDTDAEASDAAMMDYMDGVGPAGNITTFYSWMWRRAPNYFDVVAYGPFSSTSTAKTISHNLGVVPEMMWVKVRGDSGSGWVVYHKDVAADPETDYLQLNSNSAVSDLNVIWNDTAPTATSFTVGTSSWVQSNLYGSIAYLFASLDGISKVGSYTGNGSSQTIDCGFSSGARFVLIKQIDTSGADWFIFDSERGIVSGNDSALRLNTTDAAVTNEDAIDPVSSGFSVTNSGGFIDTNNSGGTYIYYAIA